MMFMGHSQQFRQSERQTDGYRRNRLISVTTEQTEINEETTSLLISEPFATGSFEITHTGLIKVLDDLDTWTSPSEIDELLVKELNVSDKKAKNIRNRLIEANILRSESMSAKYYDKIIDMWERNQWRDALEYYLYIRDYPHAAGEIVQESEYENAIEYDHKTMQQYAENEPYPPLYKTYDSAPQIDLPDVNDLTERSFADAVRSGKKKTQKPLDKSSLSAILFYALGQTGERTFPGQGSFAMKPVPSEGARHPTEGYLLAFDIKDVPMGIYHYSVKDHALEMINETIDFSNSDICSGGIDPSAFIAFTSRVKRNMWRYREPMIYRIVLHDIGHIVESIRLTAESRGRPTHTSIQFNDRQFAKALKIDHVDEPLFAVTALS